MAKGTVGAKLVLEGESKYKTALKEVKTAQSELRSEMKLCASEFKSSQNSLTALQGKYNILGKQVEQAQKRYDTYAEALNEAQKKQGELAEALESAKTKYSDAAKTLETMKESTGATSEEMEAQQKIVNQLGQEVADSQNRYDQCSKKVTEYKTSLNYAGAELADFKDEQKKTGEYIREAESSIDKCATSIDEYGKETKDASDKTKTFGDTMAANIASEAVIAGAKKLVEAVKGIASACIETGSAFEKSMSNVQALSGASGKDLESLANKAREMGASTMYSASQAADALSYMALAGWDTQSMLEGIEPVLNLAAASDMDLAEASDIVTDYITAFGLSAQDAAKFTDEMAYAMANSNTTTELLGEAYKNCAATAGSLGYSVEETTSALMVMANAGVKGGEAGTGLSTIMTRLATNTKDCADKLSAYGVEVYDAQGNMNSLSSILIGTGEIWDTLSDKQQANLAKVIAGTNQYSKFQTLMLGMNEAAKESGMSFEDYTKTLNDCNGAAADMAATMQDNLKGKLTIMQSALEAVEETAYSAFDDALKDGVDDATEALTRLNDSMKNGDMEVSLANMGDALENLIANMADLATDVMPVAIDALTWIINNAGLIASGITGIAAAIGTYNAVIKVAGALTTVFGAALPTGQIALLISLVTGAASAIGMLKLTEAKDETQRLADSTNDLNTSIQNATESRKNDRAEMEQDKATVKNLVSELENENTTSKRKAQIVKELNMVMPELNLQYDEQTDKLSMTTAELEKNTDAMMRQMEVAAAQDDLTEIANERYEAEKKLAELQEEAAEKYGIQAESAEEYAKALRGVASAQEDYNNEWTLYTGMDAGYDGNAEEMRSLADAIDGATESISGLDDEYEKVTGYISDNTETLGENTDALNENTDAVQANGSMVAEVSEDVMKAYEKEYESIHSSLSNASEDFQKLGQEANGTADATVTKFSDIKQSVEEWAEGVSTYADSVAKAEAIMSSDSNSAAYLQSIIDKGPSAKSELDAVTGAYDSNRDAFSELVETYNQASTILDGLSEMEAGFSTGYTAMYEAGLEAIGENAPLITEAMNDSFDEQKEAVETKTEEIQDAMAEGYSRGTEDTAEAMAESSTKIAEEGIINPIQDATGVSGSASTKTTEVGEYIDQGLIDGMENNKQLVSTEATNVSAELYNTFATELATGKFVAIGEQICNGIISGINSGSGRIKEAARNAAKAAYEAAKAELEINSPSKKFIYLGKMSGEGYMEGLEASMKDVDRVIAAATPEASQGSGETAGRAGKAGTYVNQTVNIYAKTDSIIDTARAFKQSQREAANAW